MFKTHRPRSSSEQRSTKTARKTRRSRSISSFPHVKTSTTLLEVFCNAFFCSVSQLNDHIIKDPWFVLRFLGKIDSLKGLIVSGIQGQEFYGLRWSTLQSSWRRQHSLPTLVLRHNTSAGVVHTSTVPFEHVQLSL